MGFKYLEKNVNIKRNVGIFFCENISIDDNSRIDDFTVIVGSGKIRMSNGARYIECYDAQGHRLERYLD